MDKLRVLNIISDTNIGGAGRCVLNYLKYRDQDRFDVKVAMPQGSLLKPRVEALGVPVLEVAGISDKSLDLAAIGTLKRLIRSEGAQVVHTHGTMSGRIAGRLAGAKVVFTRHSVFPVPVYLSRQPGRLVNKLVNEFFADEMIAVAEAAKDNLTDSGISPRRITVVLNGVEPLPPLSPEERAAARQAFGLGPDDFAVGILARLEQVKGHQYLIQAAQLLRDQGRPIKVVIAGAGGCEAELKTLVRAFGLEDTVLFAGFVQEVGRLLAALDVQANASYGTEATSLSLLEGMSLGLPAVVSDYGGNPGVIQDGVNGLLFPVRDAQALADALARLMDDPSLRQKLSDGAKAVYQSTFTADRYARTIEQVYLRAAGKTTHTGGPKL